MIGSISTRDILLHPTVTVQCFGWRVFWRSLFTGRDQTFLSVLRGERSFEAPASKMPTPLERCIRLELEAKAIYIAFVRLFGNFRLAGRFFTDLAEQEQDHADLLALCWFAAKHNGWKPEHFDPWQEHLAPLEQHMQAFKASADLIGSLEDALRLVLKIESSEINQIFMAIITAASDAGFVRKLKPFQDAIETHASYITTHIPELAPELASDCRRLWTELRER